MKITEAEKLIGIPAEKWRGNCHFIASRFLQLGICKGKLRYGHWTGPVHKNSIFHNRTVTRHGWIERNDGLIIDPTRFEFEQKEPYIYVGRNDYYDAGGNQLRLKMMNNPPDFQEEVKQIKLVLGAL